MTYGMLIQEELKRGTDMGRAQLTVRNKKEVSEYWHTETDYEPRISSLNK
jgi:hypothetical protein